MSGKAQVIVCGTTFGAMHAKAVRDDPSLELAGILAGGSERSTRIANGFGASLYTSAASVPAPKEGVANIASVALRSSILGGRGNEIACALMERGYDALIEPPVHANDIAELARCAQKCGRKLAIGNLYRNLPASKAFVRAMRSLEGRGDIAHLRMSASMHVTYYLCGLLADIEPGSAIRIEEAHDEGPFVHIRGTLGRIPCSIDVWNQVDATQPDAFAHLFMRVEAYTQAGTLALSDVCGPLVWLPRMEIIERDDMGLPRTSAAAPAQALFEAPKGDSFGTWMSETWTAAIACDMHELIDAPKGNRGLAASMQQARNWTALTKATGYPANVDEPRNLDVTPIA